ncbi:MAG: hypothetical protein OET90_06580 [Desulfuromonadales bacterium]|nr:hypothetical protein [Desulfuromonadales bacterium]
MKEGCTLKKLLVLLLLFWLCASPATACFGPKLFVGMAASGAGAGKDVEILYALVTLYVQEKTGVESVRVDFADGEEPLRQIEAEKVDLAFVVDDSPDADVVSDVDDVVFAVAGYPQLVSGVRPRNDLQFTTVLPALRKLNRLIQPDDMAQLAEMVEQGDSAMQAVRKLLMQRRWI